MEVLTKEQFDLLPAGKVFASGVLPNSPEGLFMTDSGGELRWVAKKGHGDDWAIYCHWSSYTVEYITKYGDKVVTRKNILKCIDCDQEVFKAYRY